MSLIEVSNIITAKIKQIFPHTTVIDGRKNKVFLGITVVLFKYNTILLFP